MKLIDILVEELPSHGGWPDGANYIAQDSESSTWTFTGKPEMDKDGEWMDEGSKTGYLKRVGYLSESSDNQTAIITRHQYEAALAAKNTPTVKQWKYTKGSEKIFFGAPDWATIAYEYIGQPFFTNGFGKGFDFIGPAGKKMKRSSTVHNMHCHKITAQREPITEWNGEGLPPVGCEVEFTNGPYRAERGEFSGIIPTEGQSVEVVAHKVTSDDNEVAVVYWDDSGAGRSACFVPECFRPLRTEADRKREAASKEMARHANNDYESGFAAGLRNCLSIYDAISAGKIPGVKLEGE